jgi:hypothetical protein
MNFSYGAVWEDTLKLIRQHAPLLAAIAGVFLFLPALMFTIFMPPPEPQTRDFQRMMDILMDYYRGAAPWFLAQALVSMVGAAAMLRLVFARGGTVGDALAFGLLWLPFYFLLSVLCGLIVGFGLILLIIPGLYLLGRIAPAPAVMVAENRRNPFDAIGRSFAITKGNGWAVFGLVFIVGIVAGISVAVADTIVGIILVLAAGPELGALLTRIASSAFSAGLATLMLMLYAAIYRGLTTSDAVAAAFE